MSSVEKSEDVPLDARLLVKWLGPAGAKAGLQQSKTCTAEALTAIAKTLGLSPTKSMTRAQLVDEIVAVASRRIDKPIEDLYQMSKEDLLTYFQKVEPTSEELLDLLRSLELAPKKEGHKSLIELAAREISETGRFQRIAASGSRTEERKR